MQADNYTYFYGLCMFQYPGNNNHWYTGGTSPAGSDRTRKLPCSISVVLQLLNSESVYNDLMISKTAIKSIRNSIYLK